MLSNLSSKVKAAVSQRWKKHSASTQQNQQQYQLKEKAGVSLNSIPSRRVFTKRFKLNQVIGEGA